jgi:hypothetical protein
MAPVLDVAFSANFRTVSEVEKSEDAFHAYPKEKLLAVARLDRCS